MTHVKELEQIIEVKVRCFLAKKLFPSSRDSKQAPDSVARFLSAQVPVYGYILQHSRLYVSLKLSGRSRRSHVRPSFLVSEMMVGSYLFTVRGFFSFLKSTSGVLESPNSTWTIAFDPWSRVRG